MLTRHEIEEAAHVLSDEERWDIWMQCGVHHWQALPRTESGSTTAQTAAPSGRRTARSRTCRRNRPHGGSPAIFATTETPRRAPSAVIDALERAPEIVVPLMREVPPALVEAPTTKRRCEIPSPSMSPRRVKPLHGDRFVHRPSHTPTVWAAEPAPAKKRPAHTAESFVIGGQRRAADHDGNVHTAPSWRLT